ncbi:uncharacterized protein LOC143037748 [Oratosquilla oratoria]|uniref:uncharacterized protein LOC143037748 n=1 Tax=Oratosquilla oratoria TaxID=337810 RepID=UPI003F760124
MVGRVCHQNSLSGPFPINGGLKQGCVLAPTSFSLYTAAILNEISPDTPTIDLRFHMDGEAFNLARLHARTKTTLTVQELQHADDSATPGQTAQDLLRTADIFNTAYARFGMQVNTEKTKALIQYPPGQLLRNADITINEHLLEEVEPFFYLGSILTSTLTCKRDVENRIRAAHSVYGRLRGRVFNNHALTTKNMVFRATVLSTLFYACECHTTNIKVLNKASMY